MKEFGYGSCSILILLYNYLVVLVSSSSNVISFCSGELLRQKVISHLISSENNNFLELYFFKVSGIKLCPNDPVPPVTRIVLFLNIITALSK